MTSVAAEMLMELGGTPTGSGVSLSSASSLRSDGRPLKAANDEGQDSRIARLEERVERHDRAINRAFEIALRYLPNLGDNH